MHQALLLAAFTSVATALGGFLAVKVHDRTHIILGLAAGLMLGLVFFDLVPTVFEENPTHFGGVRSVGLAIVAGFLVLHLSERKFSQSTT
jgi:ZIP family zinc transporter